MVGSDLTATDSWTISLLTNPEVLVVNQHSKNSRQVLSTDKTVVWVSQADAGNSTYLAVFNISGVADEVQYSWEQLGFKDIRHQIRGLWERKDLGEVESIKLSLPAHGSVLYKID